MKKLLLFVSTIFFSLSVISQNEFTFKMYKQMDKADNLLFSPTSIMTAFAMVYEGANSQTQKEFETVFNFQEDNNDFIRQLEDLKKVSEISNSVWVLNGYKILPSYIQKLKSLFQTSVYSCSFKADPNASADKINKWISDNTNGLIKKMVEPSDVQGFKMALVNAIYFKQDWKETFDKELTQKSLFHNLDGSKPEVELMHSMKYHVALENENEKIVVLPYADDRTSMVIIMPKKMKNYTMTAASYKKSLAYAYKQEVNLYLPKFTFETPTFELKPMLVSMGLGTAFSDQADFSGMRKERDLKIGTALHKAKIIVNEEGTEAAAATVVGMVQTTSVAVIRTPMQMRVDKPFFYFIKDNASGAILFMGRLNNMK